MINQNQYKDLQMAAIGEIVISSAIKHISRKIDLTKLTTSILS